VLLAALARALISRNESLRARAALPIKQISRSSVVLADSSRKLSLVGASGVIAGSRTARVTVKIATIIENRACGGMLANSEQRWWPRATIVDLRGTRREESWMNDSISRPRAKRLSLAARNFQFDVSCPLAFESRLKPVCCISSRRDEFRECYGDELFVRTSLLNLDPFERFPNGAKTLKRVFGDCSFAPLGAESTAHFGSWIWRSTGKLVV